MPETLAVKGFLGLPTLEITLHPITVIIGPQATGKSVVAKLAFYFREFSSQLIKTLDDNLTKRQFDALLINRFREYFPPQTWGNAPFTIRYTVDAHWIAIEGSVTPKSQSIVLTYSDWYITEYRHVKAVYRRESIRAASSPDESPRAGHFRAANALQAALARDFPQSYPYRQVFVPAGRAFFAILQSGIFSFLSSNNAIDPFLQRFGAYYENLKRFLSPQRIRTSSRKGDLSAKEVDAIVKEILCGEYSSEKGKDWLRVSGDRRITLPSASSGQQEALPLTILLKAEAEQRPGVSSCFTIEEPEAHLFPRAQRKIIELIAAVYKITDGKTQFIITTHSPYVLTSLNNIAYAARLLASENRDDQKKARAVLPEYLLLPPKVIHAYSLTPKSCSSIMDSEFGIIDANAIDEVSQELAVDFDKLIS